MKILLFQDKCTRIWAYTWSHAPMEMTKNPIFGICQFKTREKAREGRSEALALGYWVSPVYDLYVLDANYRKGDW